MTLSILTIDLFWLRSCDERLIALHRFHSFIQVISIAPLQVHYYSRHSRGTVPEFLAEAPQATASEGLAQCPYVAARTGFEPATLRTKGVESTNAPPQSTENFHENCGNFEFTIITIKPTKRSNYALFWMLPQTQS